jgi:hypothetical protein
VTRLEAQRCSLSASSYGASHLGESLSAINTRVEAAAQQKLSVRPLLFDPACREHDHLIGLRECGKAL